MWRQAFPYTVAFPPKQMEIHPLPCFLTLLISCRHREELKPGFPPNWPKAWRCCAAIPLPTAVPDAFTRCHPLACWALFCCKEGPRISNSEKYNDRGNTGQRRRWSTLEGRLDGIGTWSPQGFLPLPFKSDSRASASFYPTLSIILLDYVRISLFILIIGTHSGTEAPLCRVLVQTQKTLSHYLQEYVWGLLCLKSLFSLN